ncbi:MAG: hypothetical protein A2Y63_00240 [Candidatus Riflebacteria bacterium RBG_13_59_9]|nr:MAG: hypothetical protein A2Y63_00240 [Candidatus Riflebacteria bacterium RBG_13_59_9]
MLSLDQSLSYWPGQRMVLFEDREFGYKLYSYILTRGLVRDHIQKIIDQFNISDPNKIEDMINTYLDITPQEREILVTVFYTAPNIANRYYINHLSGFEDTVYLEYGSQRVQKHVQKAREAMKNERRDFPTKDEMIFDAGTRPLFLDLDKDYLFYPEKVVLEDQGWDSMNKAYHWAFAFNFTDEDIARIEEFVLNDIEVDFSLILSDPELFSYTGAKPYLEYQILRSVDAEFVDFMEAIEAMAPPKSPGCVDEHLWLK